MKEIQKGILLNRFEYSENSLILHFFTLENGFQSYIFQGGKKKKGNLLQALSVIEITAYRRADSDLGKITEISPLFIPKSLPYHPLKSGLVFFMTEILSQVLQNSGKDENIYHFIVHELQWLDDSEELTNFPIWFLMRLTEIIGIGINLIDSNGKIFNIEEGNISNQTPKSQFYINDETVPFIINLLHCEKTELLSKNIHKKHRKQIVNHLISYLQFHINGFKKAKCLDVLETVFA